MAPIGVSALGAVLSHQVADKVASGLAAVGIDSSGTESHSVPDLATLPAPVRAIFEHAFGESFGDIFLIAVPFAVARAGLRALHPRGAAADHATSSEDAVASPEVAAELAPRDREQVSASMSTTIERRARSARICSAASSRRSA